MKMTKTVLITGTYGFLGRNLALGFKNAGYRVVGIGHGAWCYEEYSQFGIDKWISSSITIDSLMQLNEKIDFAVHCGGSGSVGYSVEYPALDFEKTVNSTLAVLEFLRILNPSAHFIYPSSPAVQGIHNDSPIKEDNAVIPLSPYGYHKRISEMLCESYHKNFGLKITIIRFFSIYGMGLKKQLLWDACLKIEKAIEKVEFFGTGEETRDWVHISDAVKLILKIVESNKSNFDIINCGSGIRITIKEVIEKIVSAFNKNIKIYFNGNNKPGDPKYYLADISKALKLGWKPMVNIENGILEYVEWYMNNKK